MKEPLLSDDAFLADVDSTPRGRDRVDLWWLGQSGFLVQWDQTRIVIDPYLSDALTKKYAMSNMPHVRMTRRVIDPARLGGISIVTSSHQHTDHLDTDTLGALVVGNPDMVFVCPRAWRNLAEERLGRAPDVLMDAEESVKIEDVEITAIQSAHDTLDRTEEGHAPSLGYVIRLGEVCLYHSGDTLLYDELASKLRPFRVDVAMLPINGALGNMNAVDAARLGHAIEAKTVIPCHFDMFEFNTADPADFIKECYRLKQRFKVLKNGERWTVE